MQLRVNLPIPSVVTVRLSLSPRASCNYSKKTRLKKNAGGSHRRGQPESRVTMVRSHMGIGATRHVGCTPHQLGMMVLAHISSQRISTIVQCRPL
ncbi:hypothetical protein CLOM_g11449 [Closterium sp. NIES-68]|nr:hypothetical protein CLOM_g11447 [Closterium sp. NIES-68]GJP52324.1 hypothetical protein CLOM_g11449 [Closterium sp. NIES-68]GJP63835.1 hypothetical protein CLOP_g20876 [Closterium sp. NIES-67]GJP64984.1 hypothetical protein CLOP_g21914 [Closterium sp. NIES-67]